MGIIYLEALNKAEEFADYLESIGYKYLRRDGGKVQRKVGHNMPYLHVDPLFGTYKGFKGKRLNVNWINSVENIQPYVEDPGLPESETLITWWVYNTRLDASKMEDDRLHNLILFVDKAINKGIDQIGKNKDLPKLLIELEGERLKRNMPIPLLPIISLEFRKGLYNDK